MNRSIYYIGFSLSVSQFLLYLFSGNILLAGVAGVVPIWFWMTQKKINSSEPMSSFENGLAYLFCLYGGLIGLLGVLMLFSWFIVLSSGAEIFIEAAAQNPRFERLTSEEQIAFDEVLNNLPSILPIFVLFFLGQGVSYLWYSVGVIRDHNTSEDH